MRTYLDKKIKIFFLHCHNIYFQIVLKKNIKFLCFLKGKLRNTPLSLLKHNVNKCLGHLHVFASLYFK